jgi:hypothetical protein
MYKPKKNMSQKQATVLLFNPSSLGFIFRFMKEHMQIASYSL